MGNILIGLDFGHGEVAASYIDLSNDKNEPETLNLSSVPAIERPRRVAPSLIYRTPRNGGYEYSIDNISDVVIKIKGKIDNEEERLDAYRAFVRQIYGRLIQMNEAILKKQDGTLKDFKLYIAAPTSWTANEKLRYKEFIQKALNHDVEWVINESDAAFYCKNSNEVKVVLVIDYGSSTIDYTLIIDNKKRNIDCYANQYGASYIENKMLRSYKHKEDYKEKYKRTIQVLRDRGLDFIGVDNFIEYTFRKEKERFYSTEDRGGFDAKANIIYRVTNDPQYRSRDYQFIYEDCDIDTLINDYKDTVKKDLEYLRSVVGKHLGDRKLDTIIVTGGASRMDWFQNMVRNVFNDANTIIPEYDNASHVVSDGLVKYAVAQLECLKRVDEGIEELRENNTYLKLYEEARTKVLVPMISAPLQTICNNYANATEDLSVSVLLEDIRNELERIIQDDNYKRELHDRIKKELICKLSPNITNILVERLNIDEKNIKIDSDNITLQDDKFDIAETVNSILEQIRSKIETRVRWCERLGGLNINIQRNRTDRRDQADGILEEVNTGKYFKLSRDEEQQVRGQITAFEELAKACAKEVFYRNELFDTQFKINN
ncbi:MAG: hypothetical protein IKJ31_08125 [Bacteroidaceae bacterium]|nr:hypothetical protein [Bacteroidaceae bacterium]